MHHSCIYMRFEPVSISQTSSHRWENISWHVQHGNAMGETLVSAAGTWGSPRLCPDLWKTAGQRKEEEMYSLMPQQEWEENSFWCFLLSTVDITPSVSNSTKLMALQGVSTLRKAVTSHCVFDRSLFYLLKTQIPGLCKTQATGDHLLLNTAITEKISYLWHFFHCQAPSTFLSTAEDMLCWLHSWFLWASHFPLLGTQNASHCPLSMTSIWENYHRYFCSLTVMRPYPLLKAPGKKTSYAPHFQQKYLYYEFFILGVHASEAHLQSCCNCTVVTCVYITAWWTVMCYA